MSKSCQQIQNALPMSGVTPVLGYCCGPTWSSHQPTPFQGLPAAPFSQFRCCNSTGNSCFPVKNLWVHRADWGGGGGEIHTQVLSCLVVGTPEGVRRALQGTLGQIHPTAYAEPARTTLKIYFFFSRGRDILEQIKQRGNSAARKSVTFPEV